MKTSVWIILGLALASRLLLVFITAPDDHHTAPVPWFNDEPAHLNYVRFVYEHNRLPVQTTSVKESLDTGQFEYYQPPLYYFLVRPIYALAHALTPGRELIWMRLATVLFSLAGLLAMFAAVRGALGERVALPALLLAAYGGVPLRHGYLAGNDSLFFLLICLEMGLALAALKGGRDWRLVTAAILVGMAGLWTKAWFPFVLPLFPLALLLAPRPPGERLYQRFLPAVAAAIIPLFSILSWYLWNINHYGRFIPVSVGFGQPEPWTLADFGPRLLLTANYFTRSLVFPYEGLWGSVLDHLLYPLEGLAFLVLAALGFLRLYRLDQPLFRLFLAAVGLNLFGYAYLNLNYPQAEARLLIPALPYLCCLMALAALRWQGKKGWGAYVIIGLWIVLPWVSLLF